jgi:sugar lactone lactonase YvrE
MVNSTGQGITSAVVAGAICVALVLQFAEPSFAAETGLFEQAQDIGNPARPGSVEVTDNGGSYVIAGGGENMWFTNDAFHFLSKTISGDFALRATIDWLGSGGNAHRKACLIARQSLTPDSPYVDVAVHGDGLVSLQYREVAGGPTREVQARGSAAAFGLRRQGEVFILESAPRGEDKLSPAGPTIRVKLEDPLHIGLAVCAHDNKALEKARFRGVQLLKQSPGGKTNLHCTLETVSIASRDRRAVYHATNHFEAPNWSRDGKFFLFNSGGRLYRLPLESGRPELVDTGSATRCNNDHGFSPDGTRIVISDQSQSNRSLISILPVTGGQPKLITPIGPSYWHGWSPDGATLAYCAERSGEFDIYTIPATGGEETRLTTAKGLDDGPDFSPDGKFIYFNSDRTGRMHIWRMKPDGSDQQQITSDDFNNWFPHPSPDGKWLVFLSYSKEVKGHPPNERVWLRLMPIGGGPIQELARLFGGQGTINVPSWSPDSRNVAFVSYELIAD